MKRLQQLLTEERVLQRVSVKNWEQAVRMAGELLVKAGDITGEYIEDSICAAKEHGAYFVVRPSVALAHARPGKSVKRIGLSMMTLDPPVNFGHPDNDPVALLFMFATIDNQSHLDLLQEIVALLCDDSLVERVIQSNSYPQLEQMLAQNG